MYNIQLQFYFTNKQNNITIACIAYKSILNVRYITGKEIEIGLVNM